MMEELRRRQGELASQQAKLKHMMYYVGIGLATVIILFVIIIVYIVTASQGNRETTCAVINAARAEKRAQLAAFDETPPTTDAGRNIQQSDRDSLQAWDRLANQLDCKVTDHA